MVDISRYIFILEIMTRKKQQPIEIDENNVPRYRMGYAQKFLGLSRNSVITAINRGDLTAYKMGQLRFTHNDLVRYKEKCKTDNPPEEETYILKHLKIDPNRKPLMT